MKINLEKYTDEEIQRKINSVFGSDWAWDENSGDEYEVLVKDEEAIKRVIAWIRQLRDSKND